MPEINFVEIVARGLKDYCIIWGHEWIEELQKDSSVKNFRKLFFRVTHTYYVHYQDVFYDVTFSKKENTASVKRCGKNYEERGEDATIDIEELIKKLRVETTGTTSPRSWCYAEESEG